MIFLGEVKESVSQVIASKLVIHNFFAHKQSPVVAIRDSYGVEWFDSLFVFATHCLNGRIA